MREIAFLDAGVRPDGAKQFVFREEMAALSDEREQRVESLRRERDGLAITEQAALGGVYAEWSELVKMPDLSAHDRLLKFPSIYSEFLQDRFDGSDLRFA